MPELIYEGHVYVAMPPLYKAMPKKGEEEYLYDDKALERYRKTHSDFTLQRYKGLGEMDAEQLWETTLNPETRMMKRIEIATVLAKEHTLCIFDEPEAGIDLWSFSMLIHKFEEIHKEKKQSLIVISHQEKIISMADRIMVIDDGKIKAEGLREDVLPCLNGLDKCHTCAGKAGVRA